MNTKPISQQLKELRAERNMSLIDLEDLTGLQNQTISRFELGKNMKTLETLATILKPLGAHLEIVKEEPKRMTRKALIEFYERGEIKNYYHLNFVREYSKAKQTKKESKMLEVLKKYGPIPHHPFKK